MVYLLEEAEGISRDGFRTMFFGKKCFDSLPNNLEMDALEKNLEFLAVTGVEDRL